MEWAQKLLSTRSGTLVLAATAAVLAAVIFLLYLNRYRESVNESTAAASVLVAKNLIPKGTPGEAIGTQELFQVVETTKGQLLDGAIVDPAALRGKVVAADIFPGHQLTVADFTTTAVASLSANLVGDQRAISVPVDSAHGMIGKVQAGDHVDIVVGFNLRRVDRNGVPTGDGQGRPVIKTVMEDITVLLVPGSSSGGLGGGRSSNVTLRVTPQQAADLAFASDHGKIWLVLRPRTGASGEIPELVTAETMVLGVPAVAAFSSFGGRQ
jgi:Flp pilus assembly protein CpaB